MSSGFFEHKLIRKDIVEKRAYQEAIIKSAGRKNTLVVLPTGIGKTIIGVGVAADRLEKYPDSKVLILAPTKPLVEQHKKSFEKMLNLHPDELKTLTGKIPAPKRKKEWHDAKVVFATPQVVQNDLMKKRVSLENYSFLLVDESHRTTGNYAYTTIAREYMKQSELPLILGLTASPGGTKEKIGRICGNLFIENVEIRGDEDEDVKPYVQPTKISWVKVELPPTFINISNHLENLIEKRSQYLLKNNFIMSSKVGKGVLLRIQKELSAKLSQNRNPFFFPALLDTAALIKLKHALSLLQTQGISQLHKYLNKLQSEQTKSSKVIINDKEMKDVIEKTLKLHIDGVEHPKLDEIIEILKKDLKDGKKAIIFTQYIDTVNNIYSKITKNAPELNAVKFIGQRKGFSQKEQLEVLDKFREGIYNVLVATSVGEEGLDIPELDLVLFYEPIPSEIRTIQRRGRTARKKPGKVIILMTKKTIDESYYWSAHHKERKMKKVLHEMKNALNNSKANVKAQESLDKYKSKNEKLVIYTDHRENSLIQKLKNRNVEVREKQLKVGDYIISDRVGIERKTVKDFLQSMIDGRLFRQMSELSESFERPVLIIEGDDLYTKRNIHPNAIRGALTSITIDFRIPILWTKNVEETATMLTALARREQLDEKREIQIRCAKRPKKLSEMQEYIIAGFPNVNSKLSRRILKEFKTIKNFVNAGETELQKIEKLGKEKANGIKTITNAEYIG